MIVLWFFLNKKSEPFVVSLEKDLNNVARFLMEADVEGEKVVINPNKSCSVDIIEKAFLSFI